MSAISIQAATLTNVAGSASSVAIFAANGAARARTVFNDSTATLYLKFDSSAASTTSYTVQLAAGAYFEFPLPLYGGACTGIWSAANGAARLTEW